MKRLFLKIKTKIIKLLKIKINKKYIYNVVIPKDQFDNLIKQKVKIYNLKINENYYQFDCNKINKIINIENITIQNVLKINTKTFLKKYLILILGLCFFLFMNVIISKTITKIEFINEEYYNQEVYDFVLEKLDYYYKFAFLEEDLVKINQELRSTFYKYQWIGLVKKGSTVYIDISKATDVDDNIIKDKTPGGLYSKYNCIIYSYYVSKGKVLVKPNTTVKVGDELISGRLEMYNKEITLVHPEGYVLGEVIEYVDIEVLKKEEKTSRTGKIEVYKKHVLFGKDLEKINTKFDNYDIEESEIYKVGNFYSVYNVYYYEVKKTTITYDYEQAKSYGYSIIRNNFLSMKTLNSEYIKDITYINYKEDEFKYYLRYVQTILCNVATFIPYEDS